MPPKASKATPTPAPASSTPPTPTTPETPEAPGPKTSTAALLHLRVSAEDLLGRDPATTRSQGLVLRTLFAPADADPSLWHVNAVGRVALLHRRVPCRAVADAATPPPQLRLPVLGAVITFDVVTCIASKAGANSAPFLTVGSATQITVDAPGVESPAQRLNAAKLADRLSEPETVGETATKAQKQRATETAVLREVNRRCNMALHPATLDHLREAVIGPLLRAPSYDAVDDFDATAVAKTIAMLDVPTSRSAAASRLPEGWNRVGPQRSSVTPSNVRPSSIASGNGNEEEGQHQCLLFKHGVLKSSEAAAASRAITREEAEAKHRETAQRKHDRHTTPLSSGRSVLVTGDVGSGKTFLIDAVLGVIGDLHAKQLHAPRGDDQTITDTCPPGLVDIVAGSMSPHAPLRVSLAECFNATDSVAAPARALRHRLMEAPWVHPSSWVIRRDACFVEDKIIAPPSSTDGKQQRGETSKSSSKPPPVQYVSAQAATAGSSSNATKQDVDPTTGRSAKAEVEESGGVGDTGGPRSAFETAAIVDPTAVVPNRGELWECYSDVESEERRAPRLVVLEDVELLMKDTRLVPVQLMIIELAKLLAPPLCSTRARHNAHLQHAQTLERELRRRVDAGLNDEETAALAKELAASVVAAPTSLRPRLFWPTAGNILVLASCRDVRSLCPGARGAFPQSIHLAPPDIKQRAALLHFRPQHRIKPDSNSGHIDVVGEDEKATPEAASGAADASANTAERAQEEEEAMQKSVWTFDAVLRTAEMTQGLSMAEIARCITAPCTTRLEALQRCGRQLGFAAQLEVNAKTSGSDGNKKAEEPESVADSGGAGGGLTLGEKTRPTSRTTEAPRLGLDALVGVDEVVQHLRDVILQPLRTVAAASAVLKEDLRAMLEPALFLPPNACGLDAAESESFDLKSEKKPAKSGLRLPKGALIVGPTGCGKTALLAALASDIERAALRHGGPSVVLRDCHTLIQKEVGVSEQNVEKMFTEARAMAPVVLLLDNFDAIAAPRSAARSEGNSAADRVLSTFLVEMDGVKDTSATPVVVIASASSLAALDQASYRPGRLDVHVELRLPDSAAVEKLLAMSWGPLADEFMTAGSGENEGAAPISARDQMSKYCQDSAAYRMLLGRLSMTAASAAEVRGVARDVAVATALAVEEGQDFSVAFDAALQRFAVNRPAGL